MGREGKTKTGDLVLEVEETVPQKRAVDKYLMPDSSYAQTAVWQPALAEGMSKIQR